MNTEFDYNTRFWNALKYGNDNMFHVEDVKHKHLLTNSYALPSTSSTKYQLKLGVNSLFRTLATVYKNFSHENTLWLYDEDKIAEWTDSVMTEDDISAHYFDKYPIKFNKLSTLLRVSDDFPKNERFDFEDFLLNCFVKRFSKAENHGFLYGKGEKEPNGLLHDTKGALVSHTTSSLTIDDIYKLFFSIKAEFREHATWMMNDETYLYLKTLKDKNGQYLLTDSDTLFGKPVVICNEMPSISDREKPILFGDFSYYWIVDRKPLSVQPLREMYSLQGQVGYLAHEFLDAILTNKEAIKTIQLTPKE